MSEIQKNQLSDGKIPVDHTFNELLRDGFVLPHDHSGGLVVLIKGRPGTGKSTLALHLLQKMSPRGLSVERHYYSVEQTALDISRKVAVMLVDQAFEKSKKGTPKDGRIYITYDKKAFFDYTANAGVTIPSQNKFAFTKLNWSIDLDQSHGKKEEMENQAAEVRESIINAVENGLDEMMKIEGRLVPDRDSHIPLGEVADTLQQASALLEKLSSKSADLPRTRRPFVVVDGLNTLSREDRGQVRMGNLVDTIRKTSRIGFLVYEPVDDEPEILDQKVDMIIELSERWIEMPMEYLVHDLWIRKARYQAAALGRHQFKIRNSGIEIYPSIHFQVHLPKYMTDEYQKALISVKLKPRINENPSIKKGSLIDLLLGGVKEGDSVALFGQRGSFKTAISLDFLIRGNWGCPKECSQTEEGLLISMIDNADNIHAGLSCPMFGEYKNCADCSELQHMYAFYQRPGCITPAEFMTYIKRRIENPENSIKRISFWDLTQLDYRFPLLKSDNMFLPGMFDLFKRAGVKSIFMGSGNAHYTPAASGMADSVIFCWRDLCAAETEADNEEKFLMVYVDRTAGRIGVEGRALFALPIEGDSVQLPKTLTDLNKCRLEDVSGFSRAKDEIERINMLQGVP